MANGARQDDEFLNYRVLRLVVGVLGVVLPVILAFWGFALGSELQTSISAYYGLRTRDALVGILFAVAWFLFAYGPYKDKKDPDDLAGNIACAFALGVALFPGTGTPWERKVHFACAVGMFLTLAYFSLFLFTRSKGAQTPQKKIRNHIYRVCGVAILVCILLIGVYYWFLENTAIAAIKPVFWLESAALWAFGWAWFVKSEILILKDA